MHFSQLRRKKIATSEFFPQSSEMIRKSISSSTETVFRATVPQDTDIALLRQLSLILFLRIKLLPLKAQRDEQICTFFREIVFPLSVCGTREMQSWQLCWIEFAKFRSFFCSKPKKMDKNVYFFTKKNFPRNVCWTGEKQLWHVCRITFAKLREIFCSKPKKLNKFVFILSKWLHLKVFTGHPKSCFDRPTETILLNSRFFWSKYGKNEQNCSFFSGPIFPQIVSWKSNIAILTTLLNWFHWKTKFFWLKMRKKLSKIVTFSVKLFFIGLFRGHHTMQFSQFCCNDFAEKGSFIGSKQKLIGKL